MSEKDVEIRELPPGKLCRHCDPATFSFQVTDDLPYAPGIIGQERAVEAIRFGLDIQSPGFNIFVMGPTGTGRRSILHQIVSEQATKVETPRDWVYVNCFSDQNAPRAISLPPGLGFQFRLDMERFVGRLGEHLLRAFEADQYAEARDVLEQQFLSVQQQALGMVEAACEEGGFGLLRSASGLYIAPMRDGKALTQEAFDQLADEERDALEQGVEALEDLLDGALRRLREYERRTQADIEQLNRNVADYALQPLLQAVEDKYVVEPEVKVYLEEVRQDIVQHVNLLFNGYGTDGEGDTKTPPDFASIWHYRVNLLVDHRHTRGAPVVVEEMPTYDKLFGRIEYDVRQGGTGTDHTLIRPGVLHRANGGYLILDAESLLDMPEVWGALKRTLFDGLIRIEPPEGQQLVNMITPEPEPIPLNVKIILQGAPDIYYALHVYDEDFAKLFKVQAEFDGRIDRTPETEQSYARFVRALCEEEGLLPFTPEAVARIVDFGARLAEHQNRLSTRFGNVADLLREAAYWAKRAGQAAVRRADVIETLRARRQRASLPEDMTFCAILEDSLIVATSDQAIGQINGLTVVTLGNYGYGMPSRITARAYVGRGSVLDIQREIQLGGPIHGKGVLTLTGYFGGQYGIGHSLSMEASLSFEQVYDDIDGDSASSAELYALISAVAELPLRQDLAVTGAVDQGGRILPIGGVNEKIEGFFEICRRRGFTGTQGVVIPAANVKNLMLREAVTEAVRDGHFHIYAITHVDEGITLLTGLPAGQRGVEGDFPDGSVHAAVEARLQKFAQYSRDDDKDDEDDCEA